MAQPRRSARLQRKQNELYKNTPIERNDASTGPGAFLGHSSGAVTIQPSTEGGKGNLLKRKRAIVDHAPSNQCVKRRLSPKTIAEEPQQHAQDPVEYWASHNQWPPGYGTMPNDKDSTPNSKRQKTSSYSKSVRDGEAPKAHTAAATEQLRKHGIILEQAKAGQRIAKGSKELCSKLLDIPNDYTPSVPYSMSKLTAVMDRICCRNEARIVRDLFPLLVPSAESLVFSEVIDSEYIAEDLEADWKKIQPMGGPMPKPDFTVGISSLAFTEEELQKLQNYKSWERATQFTDWVYFPFLVCDVKSSDASIQTAARQSGHAGGIAANAIYQLYRSLGYSEARELNGKILSFTIAHDPHFAAIYAFFPWVSDPDSPPTFHGYLIKRISFGSEFGSDIQKELKHIRDFVIAVYTIFYTEHLERIRYALAQMPVPKVISTENQLDDSALMPPPSTSVNQSLQLQLENQAKQAEKQAQELAETKALLVQLMAQLKEQK